MSSKENANERLVKVAVQFLLNPKIEKASDNDKKNFLKKKGSKLTNIIKKIFI